MSWHLYGSEVTETLDKGVCCGEGWEKIVWRKCGKGHEEIHCRHKMVFVYNKSQKIRGSQNISINNTLCSYGFSLRTWKTVQKNRFSTGCVITKSQALTFQVRQPMEIHVASSKFKKCVFALSIKHNQISSPFPSSISTPWPWECKYHRISKTLSGWALIYLQTKEVSFMTVRSMSRFVMLDSVV